MIFGAGPESGLTAQQVFTNRISEVEAFRQAVQGVSGQREQALSQVTSMGTPRRNALVFYGLGGIGKSALSQQLERQISAGAFGSESSGNAAAIRIDVGESGAFDIERFLLHLRSGFGRLAPRWPAFDIAFSLYWARAHPGEPLLDFSRRAGLRKFGFAEQLQESMTQLCQEIGMAWTPLRLGAEALTAITSGIRHSREVSRLRTRCPFFDDPAEQPYY